MKSAVLMATIGWLVAAATAAAQLPVDERAAVATAIATSPRARAARFDRSAADAALRVAVAARASTMTISGSGGHTETLGAAIAGTIVRSQQDQVGVSSGVSLLTDLGTQIDVGLDSSIGWRTANLNPASTMVNTLGPIYSTTLSIDLRQPLLRGAGDDATLGPIRQATAASRAADLTAQQTVSELVRDVLLAHRELAYAEDALRVSTQARDLAATQAEQARAREALGIAAHVDALRYAAALATAQRTLRAAQSTRETAALALGVLMSLSPDESRALVVDHADPADETLPSLERLVARAVVESPELASLAADVSQAREAERTAADADQVQLDIVGSLTGGVVYNGDSIQTLALPDGRPAMSGTVGLELAMPLGPGDGRASHVQASAQLEAAEARYETRERTLTSDVASARATWVAARERAQLAEDARQASAQLADAERAGLELGTVTSVEVVSAQQDERSAALDALRAAADRREAEVTLAHLTGSLLDAFHVAVDGSDE